MLVLSMIVAQATLSTECFRRGDRVVCESKAPAAPLDYAAALDAGQRLVPDLRQQEIADAQRRNLQLQNQLLERELTLRNARGFDAKTCRNTAKAALSANDLALARDVLVACVPQK